MGTNNTPQTSFASRLGEDTISLFVGPDRQKFAVHKKLICTLSYFRAAFEGDFVERDGKMDLPEETPEIISLFVGWIYQGKIESIYTQSHVNNLFYLYIFAEKIWEVRLMDMTIDAIQDISLVYNAKLEPKTFFDVYQNTGDRSKIRAFASSFFAQQITWLQCSPGEEGDFMEELWMYVKEDKWFFYEMMFKVQEDCKLRETREFDVRRREPELHPKSTSKPIMLLGGCYWHLHGPRGYGSCPWGGNVLENASKGKENENGGGRE